METMARFFDSINRMLGVQSQGELIFHPVFIGLCIVAFIYCLVKRMKYFSISIASLMGGVAIFHYLYPSDSSNLTDLIKFIVAMIALALLMAYLAFIKD